MEIDTDLARDCVHCFWLAVADRLALDQEIIERVWAEIEEKYSQEWRYYHTLIHLNDLIVKKSKLKKEVISHNIMDLAILFHDIIYDPKSSTNEEDSANLFSAMLGQYVGGYLKESVVSLIIATKHHSSVSNTMNEDDQLFLDLDMSILGSDSVSYSQYATNIRKEYIHVDADTYCLKRAQFLRSQLADHKPIFGSEELHSLFEAQARTNIAWECMQLEVGRIPGRDES